MNTGILIGILFCIIGYFIRENIKLTHKLNEQLPKTEPKKISKEQKEKIEKINEAFEELMNYDYNVALRSDK